MENPMPKWARILIIWGSLSLATVAYIYLFGPQTFSAFLVRSEARKLPDIAKTPMPLPDASVSATPHIKVSYFGYELELPWDDVDETKSKTAGPIRLTVFRSGNALWFSTFPPKDFANLIMKDSHLDPQSFRSIYGDEALESDYAFNKEMLEANPSQITPFVSGQKAMTGQILLLVKGISMPKAESGIFSIQTRDFRGFQFENPQVRPPRITDELYSSDGGIDLIFFQKIDGTAPTVSQPEINRIVQSIHKVPVQPAALVLPK
jgi:hypothetical protein